MRTLGILCVLCTVADAGPRHTLEPVTLRKRPGEKEPAVAQLAANTEVTVVSFSGRWLLVRAKGVEGYVTRTTVSEPDPDPAPADAPATHWSAARTGDELFVAVTVPSGSLRAAPRSEAASVAEVAKGTQLVAVDATSDPAWIHARDKAGHDGWIARAEVDNGASAVVVTGADLKGIGLERREDVTTASEPAGALAFRADFGVGFRTLGMDLTSNAEGGLTNYLLDADAVAAVVDGEVVKRLSARYFVAADVRLEASTSSPGIAYPGPTSRPGKIPFRTLAVDTGVRAGMHVKTVFDLALRAGGHYDAFVAQSVENAGMLPRERLLGATLGARADIAPPRSRIAITARCDVLAYGARAQTPGLEDGTASTAHAVWAGITARFALSPRLAVFGGYDFEHATTDWTGMSTRQPGVTRTERTDTAQLVQIGISARL